MNTIVGNHYGKLIINSQICLFIRLPPFELILIGRISHSRLSGKGIYGFFTDKQGQAASGSGKNLPAVLRPESIFPINLVCSKPYTFLRP